MTKYLIVIEKAGRNYSAYSPDLAGCAATGVTKAEAERNMRAAIKLHVRGLREDNATVPVPTATAEYVSVE